MLQGGFPIHTQHEIQWIHSMLVSFLKFGFIHKFKISPSWGPLFAPRAPEHCTDCTPLLSPGVDMTLIHDSLKDSNMSLLDLVSSGLNMRSKYLPLLRQHLEPAFRGTVSLSGSWTAVCKRRSGFFALTNILNLNRTIAYRRNFKP